MTMHPCHAMHDDEPRRLKPAAALQQQQQQQQHLHCTPRHRCRGAGSILFITSRQAAQRGRLPKEPLRRVSVRPAAVTATLPEIDYARFPIGGGTFEDKQMTTEEAATSQGLRVLT
jgi:hypothetical protein